MSAAGAANEELKLRVNMLPLVVMENSFAELGKGARRPHSRVHSIADCFNAGVLKSLENR